MYDWSEGSKQYIKLEVNKPIDLTIKKVEKAKGKYNLKQDGQDLGYHIAITTDKGLLSVASWGLYYACQNAGIKEGKTYKFTCMSKGGQGKTGQYIIQDLSPKTTPQEEEPPLEELPF